MPIREITATPGSPSLGRKRRTLTSDKVTKIEKIRTYMTDDGKHGLRIILEATSTTPDVVLELSENAVSHLVHNLVENLKDITLYADEKTRDLFLEKIDRARADVEGVARAIEVRRAQ